MKAVFYILTKPLLLQELLDTLHQSGINGGTIFETRGMGTELVRNSDFKVTGVLRSLLQGDELKSSCTLLFIVEDVKVQRLIDIIKEFAGGLTEPDSGLLFTLPIEHIEGLKTT